MSQGRVSFCLPGAGGGEGKAEDEKQQLALVLDSLRVVWVPVRMGHRDGDRLRRRGTFFLNLTCTEVPVFSNSS